MTTQEFPKIGHYVDFKDRDHYWQVGLVLAKNEHCIKIRNEGWPQKYDEIIAIADESSTFKCSKIQPFRSIVRGYTGQKKNPGSRQHWKFTRQDHQLRLKKLEQFITNTDSKSPEQLNQFLRGEHYFYIQFIMSNSYIEMEDLTKVYQYFFKHINLLQIFINRLLGKTISSSFINTAHSSSQEENWDKTLDNCFYQLIQGLYNISGLQDRLQCFTRLNQPLIKQIVGICEKHQYYIFHQIQNSKLLDNIVQLIMQTHRTLINQTSQFKLPFAFCFSLFQLFQIIQQIFTLQKARQTATQIFQVLSQIVIISFQNLQPQNMTQVQIDRQIQHILTYIRPLAKRYKLESKFNQWPQETRMKIAMLYLRCNKLDKKIKGVTKLKEIAERSVKQQYISFSQQSYIQFLDKIKCFEELFVQNQHIEMFKKSIQFMSVLYKYDMVGVKNLCFVWSTTINKHGAIVTLLFQFWIQMAYIVQMEDLQSFVKIVFMSINDAKTENSEFYEFFFDLTIAIINNSHKNVESMRNQAQQILKTHRLIEQMIRIGYWMLLKNANQPFCSHLISKYSNIVHQSHNSSQLIHNFFQNLSKKQEFRICLQLLNDVYVNRERLDMYVPQNIKLQLIQCMKSSEITIFDAGYILSIIQNICNLGSKHSLKSSQLLSLWIYFTSFKQEYKRLFFEWILPLRNDQISDNNYSPSLVSCLNYDLKRFFLSQIFDNEQYVNYSCLSKKQASIILQLIIQVNLHEQKLERKKFFEIHHKHLNKVKQIQLTNENILWKIFENCKKVDIIQYLCRYLTKLYFCFSFSLCYSLRKSRIDFIMERIIKNIKDGFSNNNLRLINCCLYLLKCIFQYVKQDQRAYYMSQEPSPYKFKLQIKYFGGVYKIDVPQNQSIVHLKLRICQRLKIKPHLYKMLCQQQNHLQQLDYTYKNLSIGILRKNCIEFVEFQGEQQSVYQFVRSYIDIQTQNLFIKMLQNQAVSQQVFILLEQLDLKVDKLLTIAKISQILQRYTQYNRSTIQAEIYYNMLVIKLYFKLFEKENDITQIISKQSLKKILNCMKYPLKHIIQVHFLYKTVIFIFRIVKKIPKPAAHALNLPQYLFQSSFQLSNWQLQEKTQLEKNYRQSEIKILQHNNDIIQLLLGEQNMINFYINQPSFSQLIQNIYMNYELEQIRMIFTERLVRYLTCHERQLHFTQSVQNYLLHLFIDEMYYKIKEKEMLRPAAEREEESVVHFSLVLSKIIKAVSPERFQQTQILQHTLGKSSSLYETCIQFFESLRLFQTEDFHWNCLLCGHFNILIGIYNQKPDLIQPQMITFALQNCLALSNNNQMQPLCKKYEPIMETFKFLLQLLTINKDIDNIKLFIQTIKSCHRVELWRSPLNWNINVKQQSKQNYRGLQNPGCICYMNSLLQQLFMIKQFRIAILDIETTTSTKIEEEKGEEEEQMDNKTGFDENSQISIDVGMLQGLKELFLKMLFSQQNSINPTSFARTLKNADKKSMIKINEQMDIDEFQGILFEKIEKGIGQLKYPNVIKELFGGVYGHQIISRQCNHKSQRQQQFISMSLQVKDNILKSFQSLVESQLLDGVNKYHCQKCDKKVKALKIQTVKKFPPFLILCLKRFEFDYEVDTKIKINNYCEFPQKLNLLPFSEQQIIKNSAQTSIQEEIKKLEPPQFFDYQLKGVVVHTGSADSGHYYSLVEDKGKWFQFNDEEVFPFEVQKLGQEAFGCKTYKYQGKNKNAYLLLYQRKDRAQIPGQIQEKVLSKQQNKVLIEKIKSKNRQIRKFQIVFSEEYDNLIKKIGINLAQLSSNSELLKTWSQFYLSYYFLVKARKQNQQYFMALSKTLEHEITINPIFCRLYLKLFTSPRFVQEYFVYNPIREKCRILAHMFGVALKTFYNMMKHQSCDQNEVINKVFQCLKAVFICNSPISELIAIISKFMEHLICQNDLKFAFKIIQAYNFEKILFNFAFGLSMDKKSKNQYEAYCKNKLLDIPFLAPLFFTGKKYNHVNNAQIWKLITIMLNINNQFLESEQYSEFQIKEFCLSNKKYFIDYLNQANIEGKILNHIHQISIYRSVYYFYKALKEIDFNYKVFPFIEKALKDYESIKYRPYFIYLESAINDPQTPTFEKEKVLTLIQKAYKQNEKYFLQLDLIHQWILRLVSMNEQFLQIFESKGIFIGQILDRIYKYPYPNIPDLGKKFKNHNNQRTLNKLLGILVATQTKQYEFNSLRMKKQYQAIRSYDYKSTKRYFPPQDSYDLAEQIQVYDFIANKWKKARVIQNNFGQLTVIRDSKDESQSYFWQDSEKLRPYFSNDEGQVTPPQSDVSYQSDSSFSESKPLK